MAEIATSPQSWFVLFVLGLALLSITGRRSQARREPTDALATAKSRAEWHGTIDTLSNQISELADSHQVLKDQLNKVAASGKLSMLDRTALLLLHAINDVPHIETIEEAIRYLPKPGALPTIDDETLAAVTTKLEEYLDDVGSNLSGTPWERDFALTLQRAEAEADQDLPKMTVPQGVNPYKFRVFQIASTKRDRTGIFLQNILANAKMRRRATLELLRERFDLHR